MDNYQYDFAELYSGAVYNKDERERKALTALIVLREYFKTQDLSTLRLLDVGASTGFICNYLAPSFEKIDGIDIDEKAISFAKKNFHNTPNLEFHIGDAMNLAYPDQTFDVVKFMSMFLTQNV